MDTNGASTSDNGPSTVVPPPKKESRKPKYSKFTQQELPACKPLLTPGWVITTFLVVGIIFIPIGAVTLLASNSVKEIVYRYDDSCLSNLTTKQQKVDFIQDSTTLKQCNKVLTVPHKMKAPIYVYYQLDNFYQNHRRYVKSYDANQIRKDSNVGIGASSSCKPEQNLNGQPIVPCGLIAWSLFNDTYTFTTGGNNIAVNRKGISWKSDRDDKFGKILPQNFPNNFPDQNKNSSLVGGGRLDPTTPLDQDEDLIVWMRTAALPTFRKLWGKIETDLVANQTISVGINNRYNTYTFSGKKKLVLSTTSWLGGKNNFLGVAYLTVGILCVVLALIFFAIHFKNPRQLGDPSYLSWNRKTTVVPNSSSG